MSKPAIGSERAQPQNFSDVERCVDVILERCDRKIVLGLPLGLGKANHIANELFRRACEDSSISLSIFTALTLEVPKAQAGLQARLIEPLNSRLFAAYPELLYVEAQRAGRLPANISVKEFFFLTAAHLSDAGAQQSYVSSNYTHAIRDLLDAGVNVLAQLVARQLDRFSLSCNTDITVELLKKRALQPDSYPFMLVGQVNSLLPFMPNDAEIAASEFDLVLEAPDYEFPLFAPPNRPISLADYAMALQVSSVIKDGGTLQIGIGALGDAVAYILGLRHNENEEYTKLSADCKSIAKRTFPEVETEEFAHGLYGCSEMLVYGFLYLRDCGVLVREVYADAATQQRANEGGYENLSDTSTQSYFLHGGFFLGSSSMYEKLRGMPEDEKSGINMTSVAYVNQLYGDEELKRLQRLHGRFVNTALMVTLTGAVVSDGLQDAQVISGVGGQYNFVAMAHELADAHSIIALPATRMNKGKAESNIVWEYPHCTIPRHLRDIVATEYGIADLRAKSDRDVICAMLAICDSRFQNALLKKAKSAGKIEADYKLPSAFKHNLPATITSLFHGKKRQKLFPYFPFGSEFSATEAELALALGALKDRQGNKLAMTRWFLRGCFTPRLQKKFRAHLERMELVEVDGVRQRLMRRLLLAALAATSHSLRPLWPAS